MSEIKINITAKQVATAINEKFDYTLEELKPESAILFSHNSFNDLPNENKCESNVWVEHETGDWVFHDECNFQEARKGLLEELSSSFWLYAISKTPEAQILEKEHSQRLVYNGWDILGEGGGQLIVTKDESYNPYDGVDGENVVYSREFPKEYFKFKKLIGEADTKGKVIDVDYVVSLLNKVA